MKSLLILGRQPELGLSELESLYGENRISNLDNKAVLVDIDPCLLAFKRLGGSLKFGKLLIVLETVLWQDIENFLAVSSPEHVKNMPPGKMTLGLSLYGFNLDVRQLSKSALKIKRAITSTGRSVRLVPNKNLELNTAQVIHNKLTKERSWELLIVRSGNKTYIAQTVMVQDIEAYAKRDQQRPFRDARIGMLPPKLAQIILNLASGPLPENELKSICDLPEDKNYLPDIGKTVLDPFCGSGVILQEASLMGYKVLGSDINPKMVEYTKNNLKWLSERYNHQIDSKDVTIEDATKTTWPKFNFIASEMNLGKPLSSIPQSSELDRMAKEIDDLLKRLLLNIAGQTKPGLRLCLAVPAWQVSNDQFKSLPVIDHLTDIGYNAIDFKSVSTRLIYYRPQQLVGRQLLVLTRN